jgi:hypothetical protein
LCPDKKSVSLWSELRRISLAWARMNKGDWNMTR